MTYCLAMRLSEGLLFVADTRTNAGVDNVSTYRKLHVLRPADDRVFVVESAGNLGTTHEVLDRIARDLAAPGEHESLATVARLFEAALYLGRLGREVAAEHAAALGGGADATFLLGGQIAGQPPDIFLVYSEGNYIRASDEVPFLQIGEAKYGKFLLELAVREHVDLETAAKIALTSMMSTHHANVAVGPPYDVAAYRNDSLELFEARIEAGSPFLVEIEQRWATHLRGAIADLPPIPAHFFEPDWIDDGAG